MTPESGLASDNAPPRFDTTSESSSARPRTATWQLNGRSSIQTPDYIAITSRGAVPHITQDTLINNTDIDSVYVALEDFADALPKGIPPAACFFDKHRQQKDDIESPRGSNLRRFIALPEDKLLILGPRRCVPVQSPTPNTDTTLGVYTSVGFHPLPISTYLKLTTELDPDLLIAPGEIPIGIDHTDFSKRMKARIVRRTIDWVRQTIAYQDCLPETQRTPLLVPLAPLPQAAQTPYIDFLQENLAAIHGLVVTDPIALDGLPQTLTHLPRISQTNPSTPHQLLEQISLGIDVFTLTFVNAATDAGIALTFTFPAPSPDPVQPVAPTSTDTESDSTPSTPPWPLGIDMWTASHAKTLLPLVTGCKCYTCTHHHRAYIRHLLVAQEMLGWVLLQIHNHAMLDAFFSGVRSTISEDSSSAPNSRSTPGSFESERKRFSQVHVPTLPVGTGKGPRVRGYQFKSEGPGEVKRNVAAFEKYASTADTDAGVEVATEAEEVKRGEMGASL